MPIFNLLLILSSLNKYNVKNIIIADSTHLFQLGLKSIIEKKHNNVKIELIDKKKEIDTYLKENLNGYLFIDPFNICGLTVAEVLEYKDKYNRCHLIFLIGNGEELAEEILLDKRLSGCILKSNSEIIFIEAIRKILNNERYLCQSILQNLIENKSIINYKKKLQLTRREQEIMEFISIGKTADEIAKELFISVHTFRTHRKNIMKKMGVHSTSELILNYLK